MQPTDLQGQDQESASGAMATADTAEAIRLKTVLVLADRIRLLGVDRSGAYEHYNIQLARGFPIGRGEMSALDLVKSKLPNLRSYHEIGSAMATLPLMLAYEGFASVGIERDDRRHLTALVVLREMAKDVPSIESTCRLIGAPFPDPVSDLDVSESMAILTDFVGTQEPRAYVRLCEELARYKSVLMDLQRFCVYRPGLEEQLKLLDELKGYGLEPCEDVIDLGSAGYYQLLRSLRAEELRRGMPTAPTSGEQTGDRQVMVAVPSAGSQLAPLPAREVQTVEVARPGSDKADTLNAPWAMGLPQLPGKAKRKRFGGWLGVSAWLMIGVPSLLAIVYYGFIASPQYVSSFQFTVRGPSQAAAHAGGGGLMQVGAASPDSFVVNDYVNSTQALVDVEQKIDVKAMFAKPSIDFWSRLRSDATAEEMQTYWNRMVFARFDVISGNIIVTAHAFTPQDSLKLAEELVAAADHMFRTMNTQAQRDFVKIADENTERAQQRLAEASRALVAFREQSGMVDPSKTAQAGDAVVDELRKQLVHLQGQYNGIKAQAPNAPSLPAMAKLIASLEAQIAREQPLGPSTAKSVSAEVLARYQALEIERLASEKLYGEAVALRSQAYLTAQRQQSYLALFVAPTLPQSSTYPNRLRSMLSVILSAALAWFIGMVVVYGIRDHLA